MQARFYYNHARINYLSTFNYFTRTSRFHIYADYAQKLKFHYATKMLKGYFILSTITCMYMFTVRSYVVIVRYSAMENVKMHGVITMNRI